MKKLLILSGKGGTGKTTTAAAFMDFARARAVADCDVDAPNLHLVSHQTEEPQVKDFMGADKAVADAAACTGCGTCIRHCRFNALTMDGGVCRVNEYACEGCGVCARVCPAGAIALGPDIAGTQKLYADEQHAFATATLKMGRGNSGKLVTEVKKSMEAAAPETQLAIIDGSPGIGCPVIASMNGVDLVLIVAEPSRSGRSDLERLVRTARTFRTELAVCVNKWDASPENAFAIRSWCESEGIPFAGMVPYDKSASAAINAGQSLAEVPCPARDALHGIFRETCRLMGVEAG